MRNKRRERKQESIPWCIPWWHLELPIQQAGNAPKCNLTRQQWKQLHWLKLNRNSIVKEIDNGGEVIVIDANLDTNIIEYMPPENRYYEKAEQWKLHKVIKQLTDFIQSWQNRLTCKEFDHLTNVKCKTNNLYWLPKLRKNKLIYETSNSHSWKWIRHFRIVVLYFLES